MEALDDAGMRPRENIACLGFNCLDLYPYVAFAYILLQELRETEKGLVISNVCMLWTSMRP